MHGGLPRSRRRPRRQANIRRRLARSSTQQEQEPEASQQHRPSTGSPADSSGYSGQAVDTDAAPRSEPLGAAQQQVRDSSRSQPGHRHRRSHASTQRRKAQTQPHRRRPTRTCSGIQRAGTVHEMGLHRVASGRPSRPNGTSRRAGCGCRTGHRPEVGRLTGGTGRSRVCTMRIATVHDGRTALRAVPIGGPDAAPSASCHRRPEAAECIAGPCAAGLRNARRHLRSRSAGTRDGRSKSWRTDDPFTARAMQPATIAECHCRPRLMRCGTTARLPAVAAIGHAQIGGERHEHPADRRRGEPAADAAHRAGEHGPPRRRGRATARRPWTQLGRTPVRRSPSSTCGWAASTGWTCCRSCCGWRRACASSSMTAYATIDTAVEAMRRGAFDYLPKPFTPDQLRVVLDRVGAGAPAANRRWTTWRSRCGRSCPRPTCRREEPAMRQALDVAFQAAAERGDGAAPRRERHRQGRAGPGHPRPQPRGPPARSSPSTARACRPSCWRASCSATSRGRSPGRSRTRWQGGRGRGRHAVPRRDRRPAAGAAAEAAAAASGASATSASARRGPAVGRRPHPRGDQPRPGGRGGRRAGSARTCSTGST